MLPEIVPIIDPALALRMASKAKNVQALTGSSPKALGGNGNRVAVIVCMNAPNPAIATGVAVCSDASGQDSAIAVVNGGKPYAVLRVADYGPLLMGELYVRAINADNFVTVTEVYIAR